MIVELKIRELQKEVKLRRSVREAAAKAYESTPSSTFEDHLGIQKFKLRRSQEKLLAAIAFRNAHPVRLQIGEHT